MRTKKVLGAIATGIAAAAMVANPQPAQVKQANEITVNHQQKAARTEQKATKSITRHNVNGSGLDLITRVAFGMTPKEYGIRFGHGNKRGKTNRLRLSHNKKVKNRISSSHK